MTILEKLEKDNGEPIDAEMLATKILVECKYCIYNGECDLDMNRYNCREGRLKWLNKEYEE